MRRSNQRPVTVTDIRAGSNGVGKSSVATIVVDGQITKARTAQHGLTAGSTEQAGNNGTETGRQAICTQLQDSTSYIA